MPDRASSSDQTSTTRLHRRKPGPAFRDKPSPAQEGNAGSGLTAELELHHPTAASQARSGVSRKALPSAGGECRNRSRASAQIASDHSHSIVAGGFPEMS